MNAERIERIVIAKPGFEFCACKKRDNSSSNPDHYRANLLRGRILSLQKIPDQALPNLQKAVEVQPASVEAHLFLGDAYAQLGRQQDALREREEAARLRQASPSQPKSN